MMAANPFLATCARCHRSIAARKGIGYAVDAQTPKILYLADAPTSATWRWFHKGSSRCQPVASPARSGTA